jgi:hypothetical protein
MARPPRVPQQLRFLPFRGSSAIAEGLLTRGMLQNPIWTKLLPDVYAHRDAPLIHRTWCQAAALILPAGAAIGGLSAAYLWGADLVDGDSPVSVVLPRKGRLKPHPRLVISHASLSDGDLRRFSGVPLTGPERTAFDLGRRPPLDDAVVAIDALTHRRVPKLDDLRAYSAKRSTWPGSRQLATVLTLTEPLTESPMETRLRLLVMRAGLPRPVAQHEIRDGYGLFLARVDLAYPRYRLALEYDGDHHRDRDTFRHDLGRANALRAAGWTVLRFTADDVLRQPGRIVAQIVAVIRDQQPLPNRMQIIPAK